jgi:acetyl-CoA acetyltransferase
MSKELSEISFRRLPHAISKDGNPCAAKHPLGMSGARITASVALELNLKGGQRSMRCALAWAKGSQSGWRVQRDVFS